MPSSPLTLLDACAVVNLYATRFMTQIVAEIDSPVAVVDRVEREAQYVFRGGGGEDAREREPVDLQPLIVGGALLVLSTSDEAELLTFIDLTQEVDEGEAMTVAIAVHRNGVVVTDDRRASRVLRERGVPLRSTLDLIKTWSERQAIARETLRSALIDLRQRGTYEPSRSHPLRIWWDEAIRPPRE